MTMKVMGLDDSNPVATRAMQISFDRPCMSKQLIFLWLMATCLVDTFAEETEKPPAAEKYASLPKPLDDVPGNMMDFEKGGHFTITNVRFEKFGYAETDAIIWTLKTNKTVSCRFIVLFLRQLRDVRFYHEGRHAYREDKKRFINEIHSTLLFWDQRIVNGAANSVILSKEQLFDVFIYMPPFDVDKVMNERGNKVVFSRDKR